MNEAPGWRGEVIGIHLAEDAEGRMLPVAEVEAVAGRGLRGDRYFNSRGSYSDRPDPSREMTLVESEALDALQRDYALVLEPGASRRNITTRGVALNHLVDKEFRVGAARLRGLRLCEPCTHLEKVSGLPVRKGLVHRGGLRCQILEGGPIKLGDAVLPD
jgi:MOSC domain-containing protein YiiM